MDRYKIRLYWIKKNDMCYYERILYEEWYWYFINIYLVIND